MQNTLGRQWLATYPQSVLRQQMEYYIEPAEQTPEVLEQLKAITPTSLNPEELTLLDPACGSQMVLLEQTNDRLGPIPLFRKTVQYSDIVSVEVGRTLLLDGLGIHMSIRGGWVWNLWGRDCVVVHFRNGGVFRIGTDDTENLAAFLERKISG